MHDYDYLILGGGMAGLSAATAIRQQTREASVAILSGEDLAPYARPMLTKLPMAHYVPENTLLRPAAWYEEQRIRLYLNCRVDRLDAGEKTVETTRGCFRYRKCIYALGAYNFIPPFPGRELPGVHSLRTASDVDVLRRSSMGAQNAAIIGGGVIGLEAAYLLAEEGMQVTVIETAPYLMPRLLDPESSKELEHRITDFRVITGARVERILGQDRVSTVAVAGCAPVAADMVIISCGIRANTAIAQQAGAVVDRAVVVDEMMRTTLPDVYACGDCAQYNGVNSGLWDQAYVQGTAAGINAAGGHCIYRGSDMALVLNCPEFSLYSIGDLGKIPGKNYEQTTQTLQNQHAFLINPRPAETVERSFFADGRRVGTFLLGNLELMQERVKEILGEKNE